MFKSTDAAALSCCLLCDISWVDRDMSSHLGYRDSSGILRSDVIQVQTDETLGTQKHTITDTGSYYQEVPTPRKPSTTHTHWLPQDYKQLGQVVVRTGFLLVPPLFPGDSIALSSLA